MYGIKTKFSATLIGLVVTLATATLQAVPDDSYEPNDTLAQAYQGLPADTWLSDHNGFGVHNDDDWFQVVISDTEFMRIRVECLHAVAEGDLDLAFYNSAGADLKMVWTSTDNEYLDIKVPQIGTYYIRVYAGDGSPDGNSYDLRWKALPTSEDLYEPNNTLATAFTGLPIDTWLSTINGPGLQNDYDWYRVHVTDVNRRRLIIDCLFTHAEGDIDIALFNAAGTELSYPYTETDNEQIDFIVPEVGYYYVQVWFGDKGNAYDLRWITEETAPLALEYITIEGPSSVNENSNAAYSCIAHYNDSSTQDVTTEVAWGENSSYTTISSAGVLSTGNVLINQSVTVTAVYAGKNASKTVTIVDVPLVVTSLVISGPDQVQGGGSAQYTCTAYYNDASSADVTTQCSWSDNSSAVSISGGGWLSAQSVNVDEVVTISALFSGVTISKDITVLASETTLTYTDWLFQQEVPELYMEYADCPAGDGIPNLLKYACKLPAMEFCSTTNLMTVAMDSQEGIFSITYRVWKNANDAQVVPVFAISLEGPWYPVEISSKVGEADDIEYWQAAIPVFGSGFMRLMALPTQGGVMSY